MMLIGHIFTPYATPIKHIYSYFLCTFSGIHDNASPVKETKIKRKPLLNAWMSKGLQKSSKKKQKLYDRFLKNRTDQNEKRYKDYKSLFEILKKKLKNFFIRGNLWIAKIM